MKIQNQIKKKNQRQMFTEDVHIVQNLDQKLESSAKIAISLHAQSTESALYCVKFVEMNFKII